MPCLVLLADVHLTFVRNRFDLLASWIFGQITLISFLNKVFRLMRLSFFIKLLFWSSVYIYQFVSSIILYLWGLYPILTPSVHTEKYFFSLSFIFILSVHSFILCSSVFLFSLWYEITKSEENLWEGKNVLC